MNHRANIRNVAARAGGAAKTVRRVLSNPPTAILLAGQGRSTNAATTAPCSAL